METAYLFPGIGLGCIVSRANRLRDEAFVAAAEALAGAVTDGKHRTWPAVCFTACAAVLYSVSASAAFPF